MESTGPNFLSLLCSLASAPLPLPLFLPGVPLPNPSPFTCSIPAFWRGMESFPTGGDTYSIPSHLLHAPIPCPVPWAPSYEDSRGP